MQDDKARRRRCQAFSGCRWLQANSRGGWPFGSGGFIWAPIWSPDSTKVLLNRLADPDYYSVDIYLLDIADQKLMRLTRKGLLVIGEAN